MLEDYVNIFNKKNLFLRFNGLQTAFIEKIKGKKVEGVKLVKVNLFNHYFTEYKYHLYSAYYFLEQLEQLDKAIMTQFNELKPFIEFQDEKISVCDGCLEDEYGEEDIEWIT